MIENNHEEYSCPKKIILMISGETTCCRIVRQILRYHVPNKLLSPEKYAHVVMLLFFSIQRRKTVAIRLSIILSKQTARTRTPGCCKLEQNKVWTIWWFSWSSVFPITNIYTTKEQKKKNYQVLNVLWVPGSKIKS